MISTIKYKGTTLDVEGIYRKGSAARSYDEQPISEGFEIEKIFYNGTDITEVGDPFGLDWDEIERIVLEQVRD